jgi:hypothetical protein
MDDGGEQCPDEQQQPEAEKGDSTQRSRSAGGDIQVKCGRTDGERCIQTAGTGAITQNQAQSGGEEYDRSDQRAVGSHNYLLFFPTLA